MNPRDLLTDPIKFVSWMWPDVNFYDRQAEVIQSVAYDDVTVVPAGNMLGKDFVAGCIAVWFFLSRSPCRIVTTSAKDDHLRVLWGEIKRFIQTAKYPLDSEKGGPLVVHHREILKMNSSKTVCPISYIKGMVAGPESIASMQGHHVANVGDNVPRTLFIADECSSVADDYWRMARTWATRALLIGNTWPCTNFFFKSVKGDPSTGDPGGNLFSEDGKRCYRRVIRIKAEDSPNVRLAMLEKQRGREPSNKIIVPGVKSYDEYLKNRATWDRVQQCVSLDADFYLGQEVLMFPPEWLNRAEEYASSLDVRRRRPRRTMGCDPGEGGANSSWTVIDDLGVLHMLSKKTPDTNDIPNTTVALMKEWDVPAEEVYFDRGGGGKQHADFLRNRGYKVKTVGFGEPASDPFLTRRATKTMTERKDIVEERYVYKNRRAEMYGIARLQIDPENPSQFGIPDKYTELRRQLAPLPLLYDEEGRIYLPPKDKKNPDSKEVTLKEILGCSPDEADSFVLAVFGMFRRPTRVVIGARRM